MLLQMLPNIQSQIKFVSDARRKEKIYRGTYKLVSELIVGVVHKVGLKTLLV